ncbi:hypothetical protein CCACVL1_15045 [Corchorus capsularis]|uniref:Uncharacterized protein n=1 Tax=Corchorus capsularis TaxID=210143 RepID=A0A1R3I4A8_COCAP|nr:hypothetical protein CCACVL1_15045 [Corchorus capsularis]
MGKARTNVLADMIIALNEARDEFNRQKNGDVDQNKVDNKEDDVNVVDRVNALCENTSGTKEGDTNDMDLDTINDVGSKKNNVRVLSPLNRRSKHEAAIGNFGVPDYVGFLIVLVAYTNKGANGCEHFDGVPFKSNSPHPIVILLDRGAYRSVAVFSRILPQPDRNQLTSTPR